MATKIETAKAKSRLKGLIESGYSTRAIADEAEIRDECLRYMATEPEVWLAWSDALVNAINGAKAIPYRSHDLACGTKDAKEAVLRCKAMGFTTREVAKRAGCSNSYICKMIKGEFDYMDSIRHDEIMCACMSLEQSVILHARLGGGQS